METWIRRACRQRAYRQFVTWIVLTIAGVCIAASFQSYWNNFFKGPFELTESSLSQMQAPDPDLQFVTVTGSKEVPAGVDMITTETRNGQKEREYASSHFYVLVVGSHLLVVQAEKEPSLHLQGEVQSLPSNIPSLIFPDETDSDLRSRIYPVMLDTTSSYRIPGYVFFVCCLAWCLMIWKFAVPAWRAIKDISHHPVVKRIEMWSNHLEIATLAEQQMVNDRRFGRGGFVVTTDFVVRRSFYVFNLLLWNDLVWAYKKVTTNFVYFVPVGKDSAAILIFYGGRLDVPGRKKKIEELLHYAAWRSPWAFVGYSPQHAESFKRDADGFCAAVENRRRAIEDQFKADLHLGAEESNPAEVEVGLPQVWPD